MGEQNAAVEKSPRGTRSSLCRCNSVSTPQLLRVNVKRLTGGDYSGLGLGLGFRLPVEGVRYDTRGHCPLQHDPD